MSDPITTAAKRLLEKIAARETQAITARTAAMRRKRLGPIQTEEAMRNDIGAIFADASHASGVCSAAIKLRIIEHGQDA